MTTAFRSNLYVASCLALLVTSLSFGIRAGILEELGRTFALTQSELSSIASTAFWGFPLSVILGGILMDYVGARPLLIITFIGHLAGIVLTICAESYWSLWISTLMIGLSNGFVESVCNPLIAQLYSSNKTTKLNHFHLWFPGGIVIGTLVVYLFTKVGLGWQWQLGIMLLPTLVYGLLFFRRSIPFERMDRRSLGFAQVKSLLHPLFLFVLLLMMGTAVTELFTNQWIDVLLSSITDNSIFILMITSGVMMLGRGFAAPVVRGLSTLGVLFLSSIISALGLWLLAVSSGGMLYVAAFVFGVGVCYYWPTMIGFVAERFPKTGAIGIALVGAVGMFAVSVYTQMMGTHYDSILLQNLPSGANLVDFQHAESGSIHAMMYNEARQSAGPDVLMATLKIPILLSVAFGVFYIFSKRKAICKK